MYVVGVIILLPTNLLCLCCSQNRADISPEDIASLQSALIDLALKVYPDRVHYVDKVLQHVVDLFTGREITA